MPEPQRPLRRGHVSIPAVAAAALVLGLAFAFQPGPDGGSAPGEPAKTADGTKAAAMPEAGELLNLTGTETHDDFPSAATAPDGTVWCAYTAYHTGTPIDEQAVFKGRFDSLQTEGNGDQIRLLRLRDGRWSAPVNVTEAGLDVWRPRAAVAADGTVRVVWSQQVEGNWDLYARSYDPQQNRLGAVERLTTHAGADINAVATRTPTENGSWIAWQAWRDGNFDIRLARLEDGMLRDERRVSTSPANDWSPAVAAADNGAVWVGWDTYAQGNYDVWVRRYAEGRLEEPRPVATSTRFEARPNLCVDGKNRLWVAFEDAGSNWGKDYGPRLVGQGVPFYYERNVIVRCLENGELKETLRAPRSDRIYTHYDDKRYEAEFKHRISLPRLSLDARGNLWLLYRRHPLPKSARGERWISFARYLDGKDWSDEIRLPSSDNLLDNRPALAPAGETGLLAVYSTDGRNRGARSAKINNLNALVLDAEARAAAPALVDARPAGDRPPEAPVDPEEAENVRRCREYTVETGGQTYHLLRGEFHRHTEMSAHRDWDGPLEEVWRYGLDVAALDWIGPGDHDYAVGQEYMWWLTQKQIDLYHTPPDFVPVFSYERSMRYPSGHRNVIFAERGIRTLPRMPGRDKRFGTAEGGIPDIKNLHAYLKEFGGICSSHTSATNMGTDWREMDARVEPVVEIFQGHRQNYEEPNALLAPRNPQDSIQGYRPAGFVWEALKKGVRVGFQSSSDHVSTHISYAVVLAEEPTRQGLIDAFQQRHCYAANDNIVLDVRCNGHIMGDEFTSSERPTLAIKAFGTAPVARVDIVRLVAGGDPQYVYTRTPGKRQVDFTWTDQKPAAGETNMYYVRIQQRDARMAWASPMWVHYEP